MGGKFSLKNKRIIAPVLAGTLLTGSILGAALVKPMPVHAAKVTLKGIDDIANAHSITDSDPNPVPFVILEVVPNKSEDASLGYLIGGEEPIHDGRSLKDMPSTAERNNYMTDSSDPNAVKRLYDPTTLDPDPVIGPLAPNFGEDSSAAYELNGRAFGYSTYFEPKDANAEESSMEVRGHFVMDNTNGEYVPNDGTGEDGYQKKYSDNNLADPDNSSITLVDITDPDNGGLWGKTVEETEQIYRRSAAFGAKDDYFTGSYYFEIEKITDESRQMPVTISHGGNSDGSNLYNSQYFRLVKVTDTDQFEEGVAIYRSAHRDDNSIPDAVEYYGYVKKSGDNLVIYKNSTGAEISLLDFANDTSTPPTLRSIRPSGTSPSTGGENGEEGTGEEGETEGEEGAETGTENSSETEGNTESEEVAGEGTNSGSGENSGTGTNTGSGENPETEGNTETGEGTGSGSETGNSENGSNETGNSENGSNETGSVRYLNETIITFSDYRNNRKTDTAVLGASVSFTDYDYYILKETSAGDTESVLFCIDEGTVNSATEAPFGRKTGYSQVYCTGYGSTNAPIDKGPYYIKISDADEYRYDPSAAGDKYRFVTDYSESLYHNIRYSGGFNNYEWFKRFVLDREEGEACDKLYIDVVTVTADELAQKPDLIEKSNLIYFAGGRYSDDISSANAVAILNKVIQEDFPVMIERSMYYANLYDAADTGNEDEKVNLTLLALELMQNNVGGDVEEWTVSAFEEIAGTATSDPSADTFRNRQKAEVIVDNKGYYSGYDLGSAELPTDYVSVKRSNLLKGMRYSYKESADVSYVQGTLFVNDDWNDEDKDPGHIYGKEIRTAKIVRSDFNESYSEAKINGIGGFQEIYDEYDNEKPIIETYGKWEDFNSAISKATCIRYILNAHNNRFAVKAKLKILDLEPLETAQYSSQDDLLHNLTYNGSNGYGTDIWEKDAYDRERDYLTAEWVKNNLEFEGDTSAISIKQMGTREFIGINSDLNESYDMIYIGMDTGLMNTGFGSNRIKSRRTLYNNEALNGLVYSHVGDSLSYDSYGHNGQTRFGSGNDITLNKKRELQDYLKAGYTILLSDDFFILDEERNIVTNPDGIVTADSINKDKIDSSSLLYDFIANTVLARNDEGYVYFRKNVYRRGELESVTPSYKDARKRFARYLNISKLELVVNKQPVEYNGTVEGSESAHNYLEANGDGSYSLDFEIMLKNDAALDSSGTSYNCKLYIDYDSDGKFEEDEELGGVTVNGNGVDSDGKFYLKAGETYSISRMVPEDYIGFLPWKLAFIQNERETGHSVDDETAVRCAVSGFCAVPADPDNRPVINVLQILPNNRNNNQINTLDLKADAFTNPTTGWYSQVRDFDVNVRQIYADDYIRKLDSDMNANKLSYFDYLCQYDMIVVGFADCYEFTPYNDSLSIPVVRTDSQGNSTQETKTGISKADAMHDAILGIREYCISGRSILFTHDLTSPNYDTNYKEGWGYYMNELLRDVQGLDRYGLHAEGNRDLRYIFDVENHTVKNYDYVYDHNRNLKGEESADKYGFSDNEIFHNKRRTGGGGNWGLTTRLITYDFDVDKLATKWDTSKTETVTAINEGQITQYPFQITSGISGDTAESQFEVSMTHSQYFQLDMDTDFKDDNLSDDLVVWYAISNKDDDVRSGTLHEYYKALHNDVRNNYYIFTKGNVTYTGSGHSLVTSDKEQQLFVNTLVAAYNSGVRSPKVIYKENPWEQAATIKGINIPYDIHLVASESSSDSDPTGGWLEDTVTVNFKTLNNNFKGSKNGLNAKYFVEVTSGGTLNVAGRSFVEITPVKFCLMEYDGTKNYGVSPNLLENYRIYQATFNTADLNINQISGVLPKDSTKIYIQIGTDTLSTGTVDALEPYESLTINELGIYTTRLFDLE